MIYFNYESFVKNVQDQFKYETDANTVRQMLELTDDYNKDNPASPGKSLVLKRLKITGKKNNKDIIAYDQPFDNGITVLIADNGRGKSSIFKIIKYCLTGKQSIKSDVRDWLSELLLEFTVGGIVYTTHVDKSARIMEGALFNLSIAEFLDARDANSMDKLVDAKIFQFKGDEAMEHQMQSFFFNQFSFYNLTYTQKSSAKDDLTLKTANLSWPSYYKTIYLESAEHEHLFLGKDYGKQSSKIFEMILGLRLTYPINRLSLNSNKEDENYARLRLAKETISLTVKRPDEAALEKDLEEIDKRIASLSEITEWENDSKRLISEQLVIQGMINEELVDYRLLRDRYQKKQEVFREMKNRWQGFKDDLADVKKEKIKVEKKLLNMQTYLETESFFTNLEVKSCPHCETNVPEERVSREKKGQGCSLCGSTDLHNKADLDEINDKLAELQKEVDRYAEIELQHTNAVTKADGELNELYKELESEKIYAINPPDLKEWETRLDQINTDLTTIHAKKAAQQQKVLQLANLKEQRAVAVYKIKSAANETPSDASNIEQQMEASLIKKKVYTYALQELRNERQKLNEELLNTLQGLILNEINTFGLTSITKVTITADYDLSFLQNEREIAFDDLNESEKLRAKFAFYLSLIQLDIEHKLGRHPRFLIIDSPGSEEISKKNLQGLSLIFSEVEKRFSESVQIFIGTTLDEFSNATSSEKVFSRKDEYIF